MTVYQLAMIFLRHQKLTLKGRFKSFIAAIVIFKTAFAIQYFFPQNNHFRFYQAPSAHLIEKTFIELTWGEAIINVIPRSIRPSFLLWQHDIWQASIDSGLDPLLVLAVAWTESGFNPQAKSSAGAFGLMQIMPQTALHLMTKYPKGQRQQFENLGWREPKQNILLASSYIGELLERFHGNVNLALIAYNMGPSYVVRQIRKGDYTGHNHAYLQKVLLRYQKLQTQGLPFHIAHVTRWGKKSPAI